MAGLLGLSTGVFLLDFVNRILTATPSDDIVIKDPSVNIQTAVAATIILLISGLLAGLDSGMACYANQGNRCIKR